MRAKKSSLRVFKLRSGEEIIAKIAGKPRGKITVERPMKINYSVVADHFTGLRKSVIYFTDWLGGATELTASIPTDFILMDLTPDPDMEKLYSTQMQSQDDFRATDLAQPKVDAVDDLGPVPTEEELKKLDALMEAFGLAKDEDPTDPMEKPKTPKPPFPFTPMSPMPPQQRGVVFSISIPNELMNEWVQSGIMDYLKDCMDDFMENEMADFMKPPPQPKKKKKASANKEKQSKEAWKPPTEEEAKHPEFGNKFNDWSPFLKDYISGATGEKPPEGS
jgi:hypothetical protein